MEVKFTERGFARIDFIDRYEVACSLQMSSLASEEAIWFGCNKAEPKILVHGFGWMALTMPDNYIANTRMHLTRQQVAELLPYLQCFVATGELS
ncbi:hypothetical protein ShzoTeo12_10750 [Shinella zoogloeoides]|nr:hypothetical protein ShzoTeo12_10750 [Shinella zoogloeoides]